MEVDNLKYDLLDKLISIEDHHLLEKVNDLIGDVDINKVPFKTTKDQKNMFLKVIGKNPSARILEKIKLSSNYKNEGFQNLSELQ